MKKIILFSVVALISTLLPAATFTSNSVGPSSYNLATSWTMTGIDADGIPDEDDDVFIQAGQTITHSVNSKCRDLTVAGTFNFTGGGLQVWGTTLNNTGTFSGAPYFVTTTNGTTISGNGIFGSIIRLIFVKSTTIASDVVISTGTGFTIYPITVINNGSYTCPNPFAYAGATFINGTTGFLGLTQAGFMAGRTFTANATGNTVALRYATGAVPTTTAGYYNLSLTATATGTKTLPSNTVVANNLTINSTNTLNSNAFDLIVGGNWTNNGVFIASAGKTVTFNGTVAQTVSNTSGTTTFKGLAISNTAGVALSTGTYVLDEVLTISNGTFNTGGRPFTMTSTATATARIAAITGTGAIAGNFTIQRFITARDTTFADFSSPVQSSTFADWDAELPAISYASSPPGQQASAATYSETADAYVPVTSSGTALNAGQGFEIFLAGDFAYANLPATTMNTIGVPNQGDFNLSSTVSNTVQGWNLVGNPYASSVAWSSIYTASGGAGSGMYDFIEMYDYTIGDWAGYTSADAIEIGATQGFWVYGLSGPMTLIIPESSKTTAANSSIKNANIIQPYFTLKMGSTSSPCSHIFKVTASATSSDGLENNDIPFRPSLNKATPQMYCMVDDKKININNFNSSNDNYSIALKTKVAVSGNFKMEAAGFDFVSDYTCITLQDNLTGKLIDLKDGNGYCFTMNSTDNPDRFILLFSKDNNCKSAVAATSPSTDFSNQIEVLPSAQGNVVNFNLGETTNTTISVINVLGQTIVEGINIDASTQSVSLTLPEGFSGLYFVKIESAKGSITKKFVRK